MQTNNKKSNFMSFGSVVFTNTNFKVNKGPAKGRLHGKEEQVKYLRSCRTWMKDYNRNLIVTKILASPKPFESIVETQQLDWEVIESVLEILSADNLLHPDIISYGTLERINQVYSKVISSQFFTSSQNLTAFIIEIFEDATAFRSNDIRLIISIADLLGYLLDTFPNEYLCLSSSINTLYNRAELDHDTPPLPAHVLSKIGCLHDQYKALRKKGGEKQSTEMKRDQFQNNRGYGISYKEMPILPTHAEVILPGRPKLRSLLFEGPYPSAEVYMDVLFKLLREDMLSPLRTGIQHLLAGSDLARKELYMYDKVRNLGITCSTKHGILNIISLEPYGIKHPENIQWDRCKRLKFGTLLCLTPKVNNLPTFESTLWAVLIDKDVDAYNTLLRVSIKFSHVEMRFDPDIEYFMVESRSVYFEAYSHTLSVIQQTIPEQIPMKEIIIGQTTQCCHPKYINSSTEFDFSEVFPSQGNLPVLGNWPCDTTVLDPSQQRALRLALTKQIALIQGPPGTGKTYVGAHTIKILLNARRKLLDKYSWSNSMARNPIPSLTKYPILIVTYTNHALDQFLVYLLSYEDNLIRIGSRIEQEVLEEKTLYEARKRIMKKKESLPQDIKMARSKCGEIRGRLNQMEHLIESESSDLIQLHKKTLTENDIARYATFQQYNSLFKSASDFKLVLKKGKNMCDYWLYGEASKHTSIQEPVIINKRNPVYVNKYFLDENQLRLLADDTDEDSDEEFQFIDRESFVAKRVENSGLVSPELFSEESIVVKENCWTASNKPEAIVDMSRKNDEKCDNNEISEPGILGFDDYEEVIKFERILNDSDNEDNVIKNCVEEEYLKQSVVPDESYQIIIDEALECIDEDSLLYDVNIPQQLLNCTDVWQLDSEERFRLYSYWLSKKKLLLSEVIDVYSQDYSELSKKLQELNVEIDNYVLRQAAVIGMTTTGAAKNSELLKRLKPRIIFVEEAAEVLEAHIISSLSENLEHLILIGDHQQLRPSNAVYELALHYNLDISLFERLINNKLEHVTLEYQHRMIPEISRLILPIYPSLRDHPVVLNRDFIKGVASNVFFIDHSIPEDKRRGDSTTRTNLHEAKFVAKLALYLTKQGYSEEEITILTFYQGQKFLIEDTLFRSKQENSIRVSTVDKFQGEENTIIIFSVVRSNSENKIGYCAVENRICVALSRARNGFYIIGNVKCLQEASKHMKSNLWNLILNSFNGKIGKRLVLSCQKHPRNVNYVRTAEDFRTVRNGGCSLRCDERMDCGHKCELLCHPYDHEIVKCLRPCQRKYPCGHSCSSENGEQKFCFEDCGICTQPCSKLLDCGHEYNGLCGSDWSKIECQMETELKLVCGHKQLIPCNFAKSDLVMCFSCNQKSPQDHVGTFGRDTPSQLCSNILACGHKCDGNCGGDCAQRKCQKRTELQLICGHKCLIPCHLAKSDILSFSCKGKCMSVLECGHMCPGTCGSCINRKHVSCSQLCNKPLVCGHLCQENCHRPYSCAPCMQPCKIRCVHGSCMRACGDKCSYCSQSCEWVCPSFRCRQPCSAPCDRARCFKRCKFRLDCGHRCVGVCGEPCPPICSVCSPKDPTFDIFFGHEKEKNARFVVLEDCHHIFEVKGLDRWMDVKNGGRETRLKHELPICPKCKIPIVKNLRYGTMIKSIQCEIERAKEEAKIRMQIHIQKQCDQMIREVQVSEHLWKMCSLLKLMSELIPFCDNSKLSILKDTLEIFSYTREHPKDMWIREKCHRILLESEFSGHPQNVTLILSSAEYRPGIDDTAISQLKRLGENCCVKFMFEIALTFNFVANSDLETLKKLQTKFESSLREDAYHTTPDLLCTCKIYLNNFFLKYNTKLPDTNAVRITRPLSD